MARSVVVLRHCSAGDRRTWSGRDRERPLDRLGIAQSLGLPDTLADRPLDVIVTSPYVRCQHSVGPLAAARRVPVLGADWLRPAAPIDEIDAGLMGLSGDVVLCTHRESIPSVVESLLGSESGPAAVSHELEKGASLAIRYDDRGEPVEVIRLDPPTIDLDVDRLIQALSPDRAASLP